MEFKKEFFTLHIIGKVIVLVPLSADTDQDSGVSKRAFHRGNKRKSRKTTRDTK